MLNENTCIARNFDARPCEKATLDDIDLGLANRYLGAEGISKTAWNEDMACEQRLALLRFFDLRHACPTNDGILLFGKNPTLFLPGAYIRYRLIPAANHHIARGCGEEDIHGNLAYIIGHIKSRICSVTSEINPASSQVVSNRTKSVYPADAIHEIIVNAVTHRTYELAEPICVTQYPAHIVVESPGGLHAEADKFNFPDVSSYRNPIIAESLKVLKYVNNFGFGVRRLRAWLTENGNPPAEFTINGDSLTISVAAFVK